MSPDMPNQPAVFQFVRDQVQNKVHNQNNNQAQTVKCFKAFSPIPFDQ